MKFSGQIAFLSLFLLFPYIIWASDFTFEFDLGVKIKIILPQKTEKLQVNTVLNIPALELKGDFNFSLISSKPFIWEITASRCEAETSSILDKLEKIGYIDGKKINLPIKGKLILKQIKLKGEEKKYTLCIKECIFPPLLGLSSVNLKDIQIEANSNTVQWVIGSINLGPSRFINLRGNHTKTEINLSLKSAILELVSFSRTIFAFNPTFKKKILSKLTIYPLKDFELAGRVMVKDGQVNLLKKENKLVLNTYQARLSMVEPIKMGISPEIAGVAPSCFCLQIPELSIFRQKDIRLIKANDTRIDVSNFTYFLNNKKRITLNGGAVLKNTKIQLTKNGIQVRLDFKNKPTSIVWDKKNFSVADLNGHFEYYPEKIKVVNLICEINALPNGLLKANLDFSLPFNLKTSKINIDAKQIEFSPLFIRDLSVRKATNQELIGNYDIEFKDLSVKGKSRLNQDEEKIIVVSPFMDIQPKVKTEKSPLIAFFSSSRLPKPFDFSISRKVAKIAKKWHLEFDHITYGQLSPLEGLKMDAILKEAQNHVVFAGSSCGVRLNGGCDFTKDTLSCFTDAKAASLSMENFLGCFIHEAPIYITGNTSFQFSFESCGKTDKEFIDNLNMDGIFNIENGKIMRLSNLHKAFGFILDILSMVHLNPSKLEDTLSFDSFVCKIKGTPKQIAFRNLRFLSPVIRVYAQGNLKLEKGPMFYLKGKAEKGFLKKSFSLEKDLR